MVYRESCLTLKSENCERNHDEPLIQVRRILLDCYRQVIFVLLLKIIFTILILFMTTKSSIFVYLYIGMW